LENTDQAVDFRLFWGCFIALIATAFGFIIRALVIGDWGDDFNLTETQKGELLGVGLWPFAISIIAFSLIIDRIGYRKAMIFGFICHVSSALITIFANGYWMLYIGTFIVALGNGTVEAFINPVVATMFRKDKTRWLNVLHAGWPGGLVLGGVVVILLGSDASWQMKIGLILLPTLIYGWMLWGRVFPPNERVASGVSYIDMLREVGLIGAAIISLLVFAEIGRVFAWPTWVSVGIALGLAGYFGWVTRSLGKPLFILMLLMMMPIATTEVGTDSWISELMAFEMASLGIAAGWVLVYTSFIMLVLRFFAGPLIKVLSPIGLIAVCGLIASLGLTFLSTATGATVLLAATIYGIGKTFFWPTMIGICAEQFPRGGALTINSVAGVGMLAVGIVGNPFLGYFQDRQIEQEVLQYDQANATVLHQTYVTQEKVGLFGDYLSLDRQKLAVAPAADREPVEAIQAQSAKNTLGVVAYLPLFTAVVFGLLALFFRLRGGYKPVILDAPG
jgi:MFS family permease